MQLGNTGQKFPVGFEYLSNEEKRNVVQRIIDQDIDLRKELASKLHKSQIAENDLDVAVATIQRLDHDRKIYSYHKSGVTGSGEYKFIFSFSLRAGESIKPRLLHLTLVFFVLGGQIFSPDSSSAARAQEKPDVEEPAAYWETRLRPFMQEKPEWYSSAEAVRIADNVLLYQCDSGGWPKTIAFKKRIDLTAHVPDTDRPALVAAKSRTDSTIDNGSTCTQMEYLARVFNATKQERFKEAFVKGVDYLLKAQYENGGWPQFYPFPKDKDFLARVVSNRDTKNYFLHITFNDEAMVSVLRLLQRIANDRTRYAFVDAGRRSRCEKALAKGVACILKCQIVLNGKRTGWCAQHDAKTLAPVGARVYEKASLSGSEAVGIVRFLMSLDTPSPEVIDAIQSAVAWFDAAKIKGLRLVDKPDASLPRGIDRILVADPNAEPLWARFYDIGTQRPIFCGNDGVIKRNMSEVEPDRRTGYMWYCTTPADLLDKDYPVWQKKWAPEKNVLTK